MSSSNGIDNCLSFTQNTETGRRVLQSKFLKISASIVGVALPTIFILLGALGLVGSASCGLLIFGSISFGLVIICLIRAALCRRQKSSSEVLEMSLEGFEMSSVNLAEVALPEVALRSAAEGACPPLNTQGMAAMEFAEQLLRDERGDLEPITWLRCIPPINEDISYLFVLVEKKRQELLGALINDEGRIVLPEEEDELFTLLMTEYLQASFAISIYTLRDLDAFREREGQALSNLDRLVNRRFYHYKTFYGASVAYSFARFLHIFCDRSLPSDVVNRWSARFYREGTPEFEWRALYNNFCEQACWYIGNEQAAEAREDRLIKHSRVDTGRGFQYSGTIP
ncbi:hypothetical protein [Chlamydia felis Fe/C-56]|uniref:Uncharacterized protein n=1 Tax=Chlamydia felis (strain Fe/C-56) TaxID=264202 RepID=Q254R5_CHLFF|nr:hypothetical protein [Chlamydia felis]BAE81223.1 hypothetical protein [Chlamydia felis Fe/C-56]